MKLVTFSHNLSNYPDVFDVQNNENIIPEVFALHNLTNYPVCFLEILNLTSL